MCMLKKWRILVMLSLLLNCEENCILLESCECRSTTMQSDSFNLGVCSWRRVLMSVIVCKALDHVCVCAHQRLICAFRFCWWAFVDILSINLNIYKDVCVCLSSVQCYGELLQSGPGSYNSADNDWYFVKYNSNSGLGSTIGLHLCYAFTITSNTWSMKKTT